MSLTEAADLDRLDWTTIVALLNRREVPSGLVPHAIARVGKPLQEHRIQAAKHVIASYLTDSDPLVRHEAMWFLGSWGRLKEFRAEIESVLHCDSSIDNRSYAANCLGRMFEDTKDPRITETLANYVKNRDQPEEYRLACYEALLLVQRGTEATRSFHPDERKLTDIDWAWIEALG